MKKQIKLAAAIAALGMSYGANAGVVDLFDVDQTFYVDTSVNAADIGTLITTGEGGNQAGPTASILGGDREIWVSLIDANVTNPVPGDQAGKNATAGVSGGAFSFNTTSQSTGRSQIQWDGAANTSNTIDFTGLGGVDLTEGLTMSQFALDILFSDAGFVFEITAYTDGSNYTTVALLSNEHLTPVTTFIPFSAFLLPSGSYLGGVVTVTQTGLGGDLTNLGALVVDINRAGGAVAIDLTIDAGRTVPEPGVLGLVGLGLLGLGAVTRRAKKQA